MRKPTLLQWVIASFLIVSIIGAAWGVQQMATRFHSKPTALATPASNTSAVASVDPGTTLTGKTAPNFTLTNQFGQTESLQSFRGKVVVLSFIDSRCTTICPLTAVVFRNIQYDLGKQKKHVAFVAVNANPVHTSVHAVYQWSKAHQMLRAWQFLTGPSANLKKIWAHYYVASNVLKGGTVSHIPAVYVIGPHGHERWMYLNSASANHEAIGLQVRHLLLHLVPKIPGHPHITIPPARQIVYQAGGLGPSRAHAYSFSLPAIMPGGKIHTLKIGQQHPHAVLLEFFATWCPDCQEEMPTLNSYSAMAKKHSQWPKVVGIDMRQAESSTSHVIQYSQRNHLAFPVGLDQGRVSNMFGVSGIPTQVLLSAQGKILWYHEGLIGLSSLMHQMHLK